MTQEEKQLLLKDLCARLPYGVICHYNCVIPIEGRELHKANCIDVLKGIVPAPNGHIGFMVGIDKIDALEGDIKPYLRPLSSMTDEEENEWHGLNIDPLLEAALEQHTKIEDLMLRAKSQYEPLEWLNAHHFDYRGLIEKGLALEASEGMYE